MGVGSFFTGGGGGGPFCWGSFFKYLLVLGGHFYIRKHYLGGSIQ